MGQKQLWRENFILHRGTQEPDGNALAVHSFLDSVWLPGAAIGPGGGVYAVCSLVLEGRELCFADCGEFIFHAGSIYLQNFAYRSARVLGDRPLRRKVLLLHDNRMLKILLDAMFPDGFPAAPLPRLDRVEAVFDRIKEEMLSEQDDGRLAGLLMTLFHEVRRQTRPRAAGPTLPEPLRRALEEMDQHLDDPRLDRKQLAEAAGVGVRTLCRLFERYLHKSPIRCLIARRLERAQALLSMPTLSIKEIAERCGFTNADFFTRSFRKHCGATPRVFRQERKGASASR